MKFIARLSGSAIFAVLLAASGAGSASAQVAPTGTLIDYDGGGLPQVMAVNDVRVFLDNLPIRY